MRCLQHETLNRLPAMTSLKFVSWNLSLMQPSAQAPSNWRLDLTEAKVREFVLELEPDLVLYQELPGLVPYVETHGLLPANTVSHSGTIATLAKKELVEKSESYPVGRFAVCTSFGDMDLTVANVHLEPGKNGALKRLSMLREISSRCETNGLLVLGDTNSRVNEEDSFEKIGLVGRRPPDVTWDTRMNEFRNDGRKYSAYYTRYFHNAHVKVQNVKVWNEPLVVEKDSFFLSDHFALSGEAIVNAGDSSLNENGGG